MLLFQCSLKKSVTGDIATDALNRWSTTGSQQDMNPP